MARTLAIALVALTVAACSGDKESKPADKKKKDETADNGKKKSNVKKIVTAVPPDKKVACADLIPDLAKFKELVAPDIKDEIVDNGKSHRGASAVCRFMRDGEPPKDDAQLAKMKAENKRLGVLPGDEYCTIKLFCSFATDEADFKDNCEKSKKKEEATGSRTVYEGNADLGQFACVRKTDRPPSDYAYTYRTIDKDTRCIFEVLGGPSVVNEELVQNCTKAAIDSIGPQHLKKFN